MTIPNVIKFKVCMRIQSTHYYHLLIFKVTFDTSKHHHRIIEIETETQTHTHITVSTWNNMHMYAHIISMQIGANGNL